MIKGLFKQNDEMKELELNLKFPSDYVHSPNTAANTLANGFTNIVPPVKSDVITAPVPITQTPKKPRRS